MYDSKVGTMLLIEHSYTTFFLPHTKNLCKNPEQLHRLVVETGSVENKACCTAEILVQTK